VCSTGCSFWGALYLSSEKSQSLLLKAARAVGAIHPEGIFLMRTKKLCIRSLRIQHEKYILRLCFSIWS